MCSFMRQVSLFFIILNAEMIEDDENKETVDIRKELDEIDKKFDRRVISLILA